MVTWPVILQSQLWADGRDAAIRWPRTGNIIDCDKRKLYPHHLRTGNTFTRYYSDLFWKLWILCREGRCVSVVLWLLHVTRRQTVSGIWTFLSQQWQLWSRHETDGLCGKTKGFYFRSRFPFRQIRRMSECLSACWAIQRDNCSQSPSCEHQGKRKTLFSCKNPTFWSFLMTQCVTHHSELLSEEQCQKLISLW